MVDCGSGDYRLDYERLSSARFVALAWVLGGCESEEKIQALIAREIQKALGV